jgi:decaprenyl-phosphate phosphoribosyltransferase
VPAIEPLRPRWRAAIVTARPKQWVKNGLVLAAPAASGRILHPDVLRPAIVTMLAFSLAAAGSYFINDACDAPADRRHPTKRRRPIAAGEISIETAWVVGIGLLVIGIGTAFAVNLQTGLVLALYVGITTAYTASWKHVAVFDLACVASGFVLRAIAGGTAAELQLSQWFLIVVGAASLYVVAGKRHAEFVAGGDTCADARSALEQYTAGYLDFVWRCAAGLSIASYALWAFDKTTSLDPLFAELTIAPFVVGILRYGLLIDQGHTEAPEEVLLADKSMQAIIAVWLVFFAAGVYLHG